MTRNTLTHLVIGIAMVCGGLGPMCAAHAQTAETPFVEKW